jgi:phage shock protein PspC (stress-responsive transcriptional regulator)
MTTNSVLVRSKNGWIAGVCRGIADQMGLPTWLVRAIWIFSTPFLGLNILFYIFCAISFPREDLVEKSQRPQVLGVCYYLSKQASVDVGVLRLCACFFGFMSFGTVLLIYVGLRFVLAEKIRAV